MKYFERIIDVTTGEESVREYTAAEIAEIEKIQADAKLQAAAIKEKEAARMSALAKLAALGLTEEEIAAL